MNRTLSDALLLAWKDFMQLKRNRLAIMLSLILLPGFFMSTLVASQGQKSTESVETKFVPVAITDEDGTHASQALRQALADSNLLGKVTDAPTRESAEQLLKAGKVSAVVLIPKGFEDAVKLKNHVAILVILDNSIPTIPDGVYISILRVAQEYSATVNFQNTQSLPVQPLELMTRGDVTFSHLEVGIGIVLGFVQVFAGFYEVAGGMVREREKGTFARLVLGKAGILSIMIGKTIYSSILTLARGALTLAVAVYIFGGVIYGNALIVLFVSFAMAIVAMGMALILAALRVSGRTVVISEFLLVIVLVAFGGLFRDRDLMSGTALIISRLLPFSYGFDAIRQTVILGWGFERILPELGTLAVYSVAFYALAFVLFRVRKESLAS